jgi:Rieske Fe-S protein
MTDITRRQVMAVGAVGAAGVVLAGCASGEDATPAPAPSEPGAGASPADAGEVLVSTSEVPVEGGVIIDAGQTKVVVTQPTAGDFVGLSAVCPHQSCLVSEVSDQKIICPCHGSQFSIADGAVIQGPATTGLAPVAVSVNGDQVVLG